MKRSLAVALLPLALGGCLPLPITIASTAFSGISYLTSGKSTTDHVLSATMEQDCALTRPVFGEPFCRDVGPDGEGGTPAITVAYYPGDRDGIGNDERLAARDRGALDLSHVDAEARQVALAPRFLAPPPRVSVAGIVVTKDQIIPAPQTRVLPIASDSSWNDLVPARTIEVAPLAAPVRSMTTPPAEAPAPKAMAAAPARIALASEPAPHPVRAAKPVGDPGADRWVVLGSFRDVGRAKVMASRFADREPAILAATVHGGQWHRVAIGPLTPTAAKGVRDSLGRVDGRVPWVVREEAR